MDPRYIYDAKEFVDHAATFIDEDAHIVWLRTRYLNTFQYPPWAIDEGHICQYGIDTTYTTWIHHDEVVDVFWGKTDSKDMFGLVEWVENENKNMNTIK